MYRSADTHLNLSTTATLTGDAQIAVGIETNTGVDGEDTIVLEATYSALEHKDDVGKEQAYKDGDDGKDQLTAYRCGKTDA